MKYILSVLIFWAVGVGCVVAQTAQDLFMAAPDSLLPLLTADNRADFMDYLDSGMKAVVKDAFGNDVEMTDRTSDFIRLQTSAQSLWAMKTLPDGDATVICVVSTVSAPLSDSAIRFYSADWKPLPTADYFRTVPTDVLTFTTLTLGKDAPTLTRTDSVPEAMNTALPVVYRWEGSQFRLP
jgi:hypothetical protein